MQQAEPNMRHAIAAYLGVSAIAHLVWETVQLPLYTIWLESRSQDIAFAVVHCTVGDIMIAGLSLLAALVVLGARTWPAERFVAVVAVTILIGIAATIFCEWLNTSVRKIWTYSVLMPVVPWIGTGLSPLLQWLVVPALGFAAVKRNRGGRQVEKPIRATIVKDTTQ